MKNLVQIANETISKRGLEYSPKLFSEVLKEVEVTFKAHNDTRNEWLSSLHKGKKDNKLSFISNHLTTDSRLKA